MYDFLHLFLDLSI